MRIKAKFFGKLAEITKEESSIIEIQNQNLGSVFDSLKNISPELEKEIFAVFVNNKKVEDPQFILSDNDEVSFMPPFAGG